MMVTFAEIARERMASRRLKLARRSFTTDEQRLQKLLKVFGTKPADEISPADIETFLADLVTSEGRSRSTANRYHSLLSSVFTHATRNDRISRNPCERVDYLKENSFRVRYLTDDEEARLRRAVRSRYPDRCELLLAEVDLAVHTGMRRGEQFLLRRDGINLDRGTLTASGKGGQRTVYLNSSARTAVEKLLASSEGDLLIPGAEPGQRDWRRWFEHCVRAAGIKDFRWHDLRHTFASRLAIAGKPLLTIRDLLGHRNIRMTERYSHLSNEHLQAAVEVLVRRE
jgi:site-specific recombinase XerD